MSAEPSLDPFALVRDLVAKIEKGINESANPLLKSGEFSRVANKVMSAATVAKKLAQDLTQRYFCRRVLFLRLEHVGNGDV